MDEEESTAQHSRRKASSACHNSVKGKKPVLGHLSDPFFQMHQVFSLWILFFSLPPIHCTAYLPVAQSQVFVTGTASVTAVLRSAVS